MGIFNQVDKGLESLNVNKAINGAYDFLSKGFKDINAGVKAEKTFKEAVKGAYYDSEKKSLKYGAIAGSYLGASAAYRVASGGGLYKDKNGNTDIVGVPFL